MCRRGAKVLFSISSMRSTLSFAELDVHLMDEMENNTFAPRLHIVYLRRMLVSAAACVPANRALNKASPGTYFITARQV